MAAPWAATSFLQLSGRRLLRGRQEDAERHPPPARSGRSIGEAGADHGGNIAHEIGEFAVGQPHGGAAVTDPVPEEVRWARIEIAVEIGEEAGDKVHEGLSVLVAGHGSGFGRSNPRGEEPKRVRPLDGAPDPAFRDHLQHPGLGQKRDVAVEAACGHLGKLGRELGGGQSPITQEGLDDAKPHRVQQEVGAGHRPKPSLSIIETLIFQEMRTMADARRAVAGGRGIDWVSVGAFLLLTFGLAWACFIGLTALGLPFVVSGNAGMLCPAIAALAVRLVRHEPVRGLGLRPLGPGRWYLAAYLIPPALIVAGAGLELAMGYQRWSPHLPPLPPGLPLTPAELLGLAAVQAFTVNAVLNLPFTLGEELGWRGHLLPRLSPLLGGPTSAVVVGVIWGLWHAPVLALFGFGAVIGLPGHGIKSWALALFFCLTTVPLGVIYAWLRFRSGSVWPCVVAHAMANSGLAALAVLALSTPSSMWLGGPIGLLGLAPAWALAIWLVATGRVRAPRDEPTSG